MARRSLSSNSSRRWSRPDDIAGCDIAPTNVVITTMKSGGFLELRRAGTIKTANAERDQGRVLSGEIVSIDDRCVAAGRAGATRVGNPARQDIVSCILEKVPLKPALWRID